MTNRLVESFQAKGTSGTIYTVQIFEKVIEHKPISGPPSTLGGSKEAILSDGRHVNWVDSGNDTFQILDNDEVIKRV
ncbi:hypothetical protein [Bradyrhizobium sp. th.b2]|uniref:hypothetical protein n=1 Tax=Bradyrhizobium sp. th-b2 TaxID=172088 RepID=UPI00048F2F47|nr:hypothetical protein [Bradyrhizobium sp. th.b2]